MLLMIAMNATVIGTEFWSRRAENGARATDIVFLASVAWSASLCLLFGPFLFVPAVAAITTMAYLLVRRRVSVWIAGAIASSAFVVPAILQFAGLIPPSYVFEGDAIRILPVLHSFPPVATFVFLLLRERRRGRAAHDDRVAIPPRAVVGGDAAPVPGVAAVAAASGAARRAVTRLILTFSSCRRRPSGACRPARRHRPSSSRPRSASGPPSGPGSRPGRSASRSPTGRCGPGCPSAGR